MRLEARLLLTASPGAKFEADTGYDPTSGLVLPHVTYQQTHGCVWWDIPKEVPGQSFEELLGVGPKAGYIRTTRCSPEGPGITYRFEILGIRRTKPEEYPSAPYVPEWRSRYTESYIGQLGWVLLKGIFPVSAGTMNQFVTKNGRTPPAPISWALVYEQLP